jgi:small subunit ribosomal protein S14
MAKECIKARQRKREELVDKFAEKRKALKAAGDYIGLSKLPRNSSKVRLRNRCKISGRARAYSRQFGISRLVFRQWALEGKIPGVTKASW